MRKDIRLGMLLTPSFSETGSGLHPLKIGARRLEIIEDGTVTISIE